MYRVSILLLTIAACVWHAPTPDPRWVAALNAGPATFGPGGQDPSQLEAPDDYRCPMDQDIHATTAGKCPRCGMTLVKGVVEPLEYPVNLEITPERPVAGEDALLRFGIVNPVTEKPVRNFEIVHEKLFHLFVVSQDMKFFLHTHPEKQPDEDFTLKMRFPKPGLYRLLSDFYPAGGTPQLIQSTVVVPGDGFRLVEAKLDVDLAPQRTENSHVELELGTPLLAAGRKVQLNFHVTPDDGIEPYVGAMAHMLAASSDLVDMIHQHPVQTTDEHGSAYKQFQFNMTFPRPGMYRVWVQFQRKGVVNTVAFNVPIAQFQ